MPAVKIPELIEPVPVPDDFVQGIARIEQVGPCARFVLYANQTIMEAGGAPARVIVRKIVIPLDQVPGSIAQAMEFTARVTGAVNKVVPLLRR